MSNELNRKWIALYDSLADLYHYFCMVAGILRDAGDIEESEKYQARCRGILEARTKLEKVIFDGELQNL